jgi:hypothetical protein
VPIQPIYLENGPNGLNWQCCLAGSSKTAPRILIFSIAMGADYSFEVKNIEIWVPAFFKHNNSSVATVRSNASQRSRALERDQGFLKFEYILHSSYTR